MVRDKIEMTGNVDVINFSQSELNLLKVKSELLLDILDERLERALKRNPIDPMLNEEDTEAKLQNETNSAFRSMLIDDGNNNDALFLIKFVKNLAKDAPGVEGIEKSLLND
jgi:hypothetical protein